MATSSSVEWNSEAYHRLSEPHMEWGRTLLKVLNLKGDECVLDAGCGTGRLTAELLDRLPQGRVIGVDVSTNMLEKAREFLQPKYGARITLLQADMTELPLIEAVDGIFSTAAIHWVKDHRKLFRSFFSALKKTGWLMAQCGGGPNLGRVRYSASKLMAKDPYQPYFADWEEPWIYVDERTTADRLHTAGFEDVEVSLREWPITMPNREQYEQFLETIVLRHQCAKLPENLRASFLDEMGEMAEKEGAFVLDYWRLNMSARKPQWPKVSTGKVWKLQRE